jgi:hypothetical protein
MLNKYPHLISIKERGEVEGLREELGSQLLLILSISASIFAGWGHSFS